MGCDIHWYSEHFENGTWKCDQANTGTWETEDYGDGPLTRMRMDQFPGNTRDYWFFGLLSNGVRTEWPYGFEAKGNNPPGCSPEVLTLLDYWDNDGHNHSWLNREELEAKLAELIQLRAELLIAPRDPKELRIEHVDYHIRRLNGVIDNLKALHPDVDPQCQRIVFWFDN